MAFRGPNHDSNLRPPGRTPPDDTHQEAAYLKMLGDEALSGLDSSCSMAASSMAGSSTMTGAWYG